MKQFFTFLLLAMTTLSVCAETAEKKSSIALHPKVLVESIKLITATEAGGDELYFVITEFNSRDENQQYTVPSYPVTWPSRSVDQINNLKLWSGNLYEGDETELLIEFIEHDMPPLNVDDSLGSIRIKFKNVKGKLETQWTDDENATDVKNTKEGETNHREYTFTGDGGDYIIKFTQD